MKNKKQAVLTRILNKYQGLQYYEGIAERGYDDKPIILANWNNFDRLEKFIPEYFNGEIELEWEDEWISCSHCYKLVRSDPDCYFWQPSFVWVNDCEIICRDCLESNTDWIEDVIEHYKNDSSKAVMDWVYPLLEKAGFICYSPDDYCPLFESGFFPGQNDNPEAIAKTLQSELPDYDFIFRLNETSQFYCKFSVHIRRCDHEH